ncbi:hypothetical protein AWH69_15245 [Janibacter melonis]|uniref:Uncharacterized protein n=1 Tax=Janibacter melonis TaxID=262209 RepID=A0A176Q993_9MICO|nr:hypothetical protein AWH69_15245 [Janibacter melonis]
MSSDAKGATVSLLVVDAPLSPSADVTAVAAAVVAPEKFVAELSVGGAGLSVPVASALLREFGEQGLMTVARRPSREAVGSVGMTVVLDWSGEGWVALARGDDRRGIVVAPLPLGEFSGRLFSVGRFALACSSSSTEPTSSTADLSHQVAAAILIAERLRCDSITVPRKWLGADDRFEGRAIRLADVVGLRLEFVEEIDREWVGVRNV